MYITHHAKQQARTKGVDPAALHAAAVDPDIRYPSRNHPGQERRIRGGICVVVDPATDTVITVYAHRIVTPLRPDQRVA